MLIWPSVFVSVFGVGFIIAGGILGWNALPAIIRNEIIHNVKLENGTDQFQRWESLPFPVKFKVYLWEVNNTDEVLQGGKPDLVQKGPYVYNQFLQKVNIKKEGNNLTYKQIQTYKFDVKDSYPLTEDDEVTVLNVPYHAIIQKASPGELVLINGQQSSIFNKQGVFLKTKVKQLLFTGVPICIEGKPGLTCKGIASKAVKSKNMVVATDGTIYFSLFNHKNNSDDGKFKVGSGEGDIKHLGKILEWNNVDHVSAWRNNENGNLSYCNMLNGTDGNIYPPFASGRKSIKIFSTDICRSVTVHYAEERSYMGIQGMMYKIGDDMLPAPSLKDDTGCFCLNKTPGILQENGCLKKGALELYNCLDSHMVLTHPHFLLADKDYQEGVKGMSPDPEKHQIFIILEPNTGTPLVGKKRVQFNMFLRKVGNMKPTENITTTLFPIVWVDEGVELGNDMIQLLNRQLFDPLNVVETVRWSLVAVGIILALAGTIWYMVAKKRRSIDTVQ